MDMKLYKVLKAPHITEQSSQLSQDLKQIVFKVDKGANKREIKKAVENLFNVTVVKVTTSVVKGKTKRNRFGVCLLYTSPSPRDGLLSRMPSSA